MMNSYLAENNSENDLDLLDSYKEVWQFYYNNPETIIERTLKENGLLRNYLEGVFIND